MYNEYSAIEPVTQFVDQTTIKKSPLTKNVNLVREHPYPDGYIVFAFASSSSLRERNGLSAALLVKYDFDN